VAFENSVIKNKIHEVVGISNQNPFLTGLKAESVAQFQQKLLQFIKELILQMRLTHDFLWLQSKKLKDIGIAYHQFWFGSFGTLLSHRCQFCLVF
jgi:hypothetical protein